MNSRVIYVSSDDKDNTQSVSNSDFVVYLKETVSVQTINYALLKNATVPNVFYNVRSSYGEVNNSFVFQEQSPLATFAVSIPEGQYVIADFMTALQTAMNAVLVSGSVAITQDATTKKLVFTCTGTVINVFSGDNGNSAYVLTGFEESANSGFSATVSAPNLPDLAGIQNVYLQSYELAPAEGIDPTFGLINIVGEVNLSNTQFGGYANLETNTDEMAMVNYKNTRNLQRIDITLVDGQGNKLPIGNSRLSLSLKVYWE